MKTFAEFPFEHLKSPFVSLKDYLKNPPTELINIDRYLGDAFPSFEALRDDKRSLREIAKVMLQASDADEV